MRVFRQEVYLEITFEYRRDNGSRVEDSRRFLFFLLKQAGSCMARVPNFLVINRLSLRHVENLMYARIKDVSIATASSSNPF